ncbi:MAG: site-2 protease family protein [Pseudomonadota bacterium]
MKWSWKIARIAGIDIYVHATFFILILWLGLVYWKAGGTMLAVFSGVGFILLLFTSVVLHEFGHALTARRYGIATRNITLLPIGGVAQLEKMPDDPREEIIVALAGPAVNLVIALLLFIVSGVNGAFVSAEPLALADGGFIQRLMLLNIFLALFNLLPAFPMDGGRILRAILAMRMDHVSATQVAASIGQSIALIFGFLGVLYNPFLIFIALFVWIGAAAEAQNATLKSSLSGVKVGDAMQTNFEVLHPDDPLVRAVELTLSGTQKEFPVLSGDKVIGVLGQSELLTGLSDKGKHSLTSEFMQRDVQRVESREPLQLVLERFQSSGSKIIAVTRSGSLVGIIDLENIIELLKIQSALQERTRK